jgi:hypothetical protein
MMADSMDGGLAAALQEQLTMAQRELAKTTTYTQVLETAMKKQLASQIERNGLLQQEVSKRAVKVGVNACPCLPLLIDACQRLSTLVNASPPMLDCN